MAATKASQPHHPALTPQLCLAPSSVRAFLRLSRAAIDDPISQQLNSLSRPAAAPFDASSISASRTSNAPRRGLPPSTCAGFVSHTLFPAWAARARVLEYCAGVAEQQLATDKDSSETAGGNRRDTTHAQSRARSQWGGTIRGGTLAIGAKVAVGPGDDSEHDEMSEQSQRPSPGPDGQAWSSSRLPTVVDARLDPYSTRDYSDESPGERLVRIIREERSIEGIIRSRSWEVIKDRCGTAMEDWQEGMKKWESEMDKAHKHRQTTSGISNDYKGSFWSKIWS